MTEPKGGIGILSLVTVIVILVTVFYPSIKSMPLIYWSTICGTTLTSNIFETSHLFFVWDSPVGALPSVFLCMVAALVAIRVYQGGWRLERRLLSSLLCLLMAKDLVPLLTALVLVGLQWWSAPIRLGIWDWIWICSFTLQAICILFLVRQIGFTRDRLAIQTLWTAQATPTGLLVVGFAVQRLIGLWMGLKIMGLWMGAELASQWVVPAFAFLCVGGFGVLMVAIGLVVLRDHRVSTNLLGGAVLALGMSLLIPSLLTAGLHISAFGVVYIVLGILAAILSAIFFVAVSSWLPYPRAAPSFP